MRTGLLDRPGAAAAIVSLAEVPHADAVHPSSSAQSDETRLARARAFAEPLLSGRRFDTGEDALAHADGVAAILQGIGAGPGIRAAAWLVYASEYLNKPEEIIEQAFGADEASLVAHTRKLVQIQRSARDALADEADGEMRAEQVERVRKMLLAFSRDLRVVLLRLASRLQTLRYYAASKVPAPGVLAGESLHVFAPLANRLGIWQIKWEIEDHAFRFLHPQEYREIAGLLHEKRLEREQSVEAARQQLAHALAQAGLKADVHGRPKHLYSIWKKMRGKGLTIERIFDVQALRVIVPEVGDCYAALARVHDLWRPLPEEFDDYIARPKPNGYQSLHTVVLDEHGRSIEIQIRTAQMHEHAESGVAAHWAYKEAGAKGYAGTAQAAGDFESRVAEARKTVLRQLLAWERDVAHADGEDHVAAGAGKGLFDDRIYVFTPAGAIIDLPARATPVDFAYTLHTDLGHRCRGARVDGAMVQLNTPLQSGQTVEIVTAKDAGAGPSLDWLNPELGYLQSPRARAKVRAWFNALAVQQTIARGRDAVEKLLQREGRTAIKLEELAVQSGFRTAEALFESVGKDEYSLRNIETLLRPAEPPVDADELLAQRIARSESAAALKPASGGVLVVGMDSLLTQLARCCKPAPPDNIGGYVTRGSGVAIHRNDCSNFRQMVGRHPERRIAVAWGQQAPRGERAATYAVDIGVEASDRSGLLRDLCDVFAKDKMHVSGMQTRTRGEGVSITLTVQTSDTAQLAQVLARAAQLEGVHGVRRR
jgi:GTP pyrophosphokinase